MVIDSLNIGSLVFHCASCNNYVAGGAADTLVFDSAMDAGDNAVQSSFLVANAPFDPASLRQKIDCPQCKIDFMTTLILDNGTRITHACSCGYKIDKYTA